MQKIIRRGFSTVNLVLEGGGAKGALYAGTLREVQRRDLKIQTAIGASAGSLGATFAALNVPAQQLQAYLDPNAKFKPVGPLSSIHIQDRIPKDVRYNQRDKNMKKLSWLLSQNNWLMNMILEQVIGAKSFQAIKQGLESRFIIQELMFNGSYIAGYGLVTAIESFLMTYLPQKVKGQENRQNITMSKFKEATGVNLAIMGADITGMIPRIFSATTTPNLPVKYAVRISSSIPFYFPPIYWDPSWGTYMNKNIDGHMFVDGGLLWNMPIGLIAARQDIQLKYLGETVDPRTIAALNFISKEGKSQTLEDAMHGVEDVDIEYIPDEYRRIIKKKLDSSSWDDEGMDDTAPGILTMQRLVPAMLGGLGENFQIETYAEKVGHLESKNINVLNFGLYDVPVVEDINAAAKVSQELFDKLNL